MKMYVDIEEFRANLHYFNQIENHPLEDIIWIDSEDTEHIFDMENAGYVYRGAFVRDDALLFARIEDNALKANIHFFPSGLQIYCKMFYSF